MKALSILATCAVLGVSLHGVPVNAHELGDLVFCDLNGDGVFQPPQESGIAGVTVVRECGPAVTSTTTDAAGRYFFPLTPPGTCRVRVNTSSTPVMGLALSTPRVGGPPTPTAEHSPFPGFGCGSCPNAFVTTVVADGVFQTTINNPCNCVDPACPPTGTDPCAGPAPFVGYYGDDFGFVCTTSTTVTTTSTSTTSTTMPSMLPACGDGTVQPPEQCDPPGSATCPPTSAGGAFLTCQPDCTCTPGCPPFPFLIRTVGKVGDRGTITGSIGANDAGGDFRLGKNVVQSDASTVAADRLGLGQSTSVGNALSNTLRKGSGAVIRGETGTPILPLTTPFCPIPDFACGAPDVLVPVGDAVGPLAPGTYGALTILRAGTLTLAPGTFAFCSVKTSKRATITVMGSAQTTINVAGTFRLGDASTLLPAAGTPTPRLNVAGSLVRVSHGSTLQAFLAAPNALLTLGRQARIAGTFCVSRSQSDKNVTLVCPPPSPSGAFLDAEP